MAVGDIIQIKLASTSNGQEMLNVFYFQQQAGGSIPGNLAQTVNEAFWDAFDTDWLDILHPSTTVVSSELIFLAFPEAWHNLAINDPGTWTDISEAGAAPAFLSAGFRYVRQSPGQRHGYKRVSGLAVEAQEDGGVSASFIALAVELAAVMQAGFTAGTTQFMPFVASRPIVLGTNPTGYVPSAVVFYGLGTQNTRK